MSASRTPPKVPRPYPAPRGRSPLVDALTQELAEAPTADLRHRRLEVFLEQRAARLPLIEQVPGEPNLRLVTFLWRDSAAADVIVFVNRLTDERDLGASTMQRLADTDLWHLSYVMASDWRASYTFHPRLPTQEWPWEPGDQLSIRQQLDRGHSDPRNPQVSYNRTGTRQSVVALPDAPSQAWVEPRPSIPAGAIREHAGPQGRTVWVYEPPGVAPHTELAVVVLLDGEVWTSTQNAAVTFDNLHHDQLIRPTLVVMPDSGSRENRWGALGAQGQGPDWIADELLVWVRNQWNIVADVANVIIAGQSLGGLTALRTVLERPDAARAAVSQSASLWQDDLLAHTQGRDLSHLRIHLEVGTQEWVLHPPNERLAAGLAGAGAHVHYRPFNGGHDYACWRGGLAEGVQYLLTP